MQVCNTCDKPIVGRFEDGEPDYSSTGLKVSHCEMDGEHHRMFSRFMSRKWTEYEIRQIIREEIQKRY